MSTKRPHFETYKSRDGWRWRLRAANGRVLASGEAHIRKGDATRAIRTMRDAANLALLPGEMRQHPVTDSSSFASPNGRNYNALPQ